MATQRKSWLPREGFTFDVVRTIVTQTLLNPTVTLPLWLATKYTLKGQGFAIDNPQIVRRLRILLYLGLLRYTNGLLNRGSQNHWTSDAPDWKKELVVITGGSDGIGKILTKMFAARGVRVIILDIQEPTFDLPTGVSYLRLDLTDAGQIKTVSASVREIYGDPSVLILNAGIINRHAILNTPDHLLTRVFSVNTFSHYRLVKEFLPAMIARNHGLVSTTASLAGFVTVPGMVDYNGTKAAAIAFHEGLTAELAHRYDAPGVRTVCICPNFANTKLADGFRNDSSFLNPTLTPETVAEVQFDRIWRWEGGMVPVPASGALMAMNVRGLPYWVQNLLRGQLKHVMSGVEAIEQERVRKIAEELEKASRSVVDVRKEDATDQTEPMFG